MSKLFCVTVTFLGDRFHGRGTEGAPEWPPSPLRLFQAVVRGAADRYARPDWPVALVHAFHWFERLPPPDVVAAHVQRCQPITLYVPNNDTDLVGKSWARGNTEEGFKRLAELKSARQVSPVQFVDGNTVSYLWPLPDNQSNDVERETSILTRLARDVVALGWGVDLAIGDGRVIDSAEAVLLPGERWQPVGPRTTTLRVPIAGSFDDLVRRQRQFQGRFKPDGSFAPVPALGVFCEVGYASATATLTRPWAAFKLLQPDSDQMRSFSAARVARVAGMVRNATARAAEATRKGAGWIESYIYGHRADDMLNPPRFAYLPLPSIEHRGDRAREVSGIRRVLIAESIGCSGEHSDWARRTLRGEVLVTDPAIEGRSREEALLVPLDKNDWVLRQYTTSACSWSTVTPVVLPWPDDRNLDRATRQITAMLRHAGLPHELLADVKLQREGFWRGCDLAAKYRPTAHHDNRPRYHVRLQWKCRVPGPIGLGCGRFYGLGLFAAEGE